MLNSGRCISRQRLGMLITENLLQIWEINNRVRDWKFLADKLCARNVLKMVKYTAKLPWNNGREYHFLPWEICSHLGVNHCILECKTLFSQAVNYINTVVPFPPAATVANKSFKELLPILLIQKRSANMLKVHTPLISTKEKLLHIRELSPTIYFWKSIPTTLQESHSRRARN